MTAKERQLWYWQKEMESCHRYMRVYRQDTPEYAEWKKRYESAIKTYNGLSGKNLQSQEDKA